MDQSTVIPKVRARVIGSSSIRPVRMTEEADGAITEVQALFKDHGQASVSMIVRAALAHYVAHVRSRMSSDRVIERQAEWAILSRKCHVTRDK